MDLNYIKKVIDKYDKARAQREETVKKFESGEKKYLIFQTPPGNSVWCDINNAKECFEENLKYIEKSLDTKSDHLPFMEPWYGTGVYANIFGCEYVWYKGEAPTVRYRYHDMYEVAGLRKPKWEDSEIANLVIDTIKYMKSKTGDNIPIIWTDTQSASDTATLVLDASEVLIGCMIEKNLMHEYFKKINDVIIEFSKAQAEVIGNALIKPGHIMLSSSCLKGMSVSDDNLAVASPDVNKEFNLYYDNLIGEAMGGIAIHSCGKWQVTMPFVKEYVPTCRAVDCAIQNSEDPNPNDPETVRDAFKGTGIAVHVRYSGSDREK